LDYRSTQLLTSVCQLTYSESGKKRRTHALKCDMPMTDSDCEVRHACATAEDQTRSTVSDQKVLRGEKVGSQLDANDKKPGGIVIRGGRIRLPDKLMEFLQKAVLPDVLYWREDGNSFSFDTNTVQEKLLDKFFCGSKLTSFARSLNRWGFKRMFCSKAPKNVLSYEHPLFSRHNPDGVHYMNMLVPGPQQDSNEGASSSLPSSAADAPCHPSNVPSFVTASLVLAAADAQVPLSIQSQDHVLNASTSGDSTAQWEALRLLASSTAESLHQPPSGDAVPAMDPPTGNVDGLPAGVLIAVTMARPRSANGASIQQHQQALQTLVMQRYLTDQVQNTTTTRNHMPPLPPSLEHLAPLLQAAFSSGRASSHSQLQQSGLFQPHVLQAFLVNHQEPQQRVQPQQVAEQQLNGPECDRPGQPLTLLAQQCEQQLMPQVIQSLLQQRPGLPQLGQTQAAPSPRAASGAVVSTDAEIRRALVSVLEQQERNQFLAQLEVLAGLWSQIQSKNHGSSS
jgi:hypothetical protein